LDFEKLKTKRGTRDKATNELRGMALQLPTKCFCNSALTCKL